MSAESFLSSSIEIAIGMAGFAGIVAAIRHRDLSLWADEERILLRMLLVASGMAITFALLPAVLREARVPDGVIWRVGSGTFMVWQAGITVHRVRQFRAADRPIPLPRILFVWVGLLIALQAFNLWLGATWPYLVAIFGLLVNAFSFFWVLLIGRGGALAPAPEHPLPPPTE
jgi:hypothetical protein